MTLPLTKIEQLAKSMGAHRPKDLRSDATKYRHWYFTSEAAFYAFADNPLRFMLDYSVGCQGQPMNDGRWFVCVYLDQPNEPCEAGISEKAKAILTKCARSYMADHHAAMDGHPEPSHLAQECDGIAAAIAELQGD